MYYTRNEQRSAIIDALLCVKSRSKPEIFWRKTFEERKAHTKWINNEIQQIIWKNLSKHCWLGFCGPWIEDVWEDMGKEDYQIFGLFIPLFIPWTKMWKIKNMKIYISWLNKIFKLFSKEYFYITVCTNSHGIEGRDEKKKIFPDNLIIIAGGGKGHIPTLIFMRESNPKDFPINNTYEYDLMFAGKLTHRIRSKMVKYYSKNLRSRFKYYKSFVNWKIEYNKAKFILAPRGFGRNSVGYFIISLYIKKANNITYVPKLFFGIVTVEESSYRRNFSYNMWISKILELGHDYVFSTQHPIEPKYKWVKLRDWSRYPPPKKSTAKFLANRDRENKRLTLAHYFLTKTDADFFINPTDDVFVDSERINDLALNLGSKYDTEFDFVMLGNCIAKGPFSFVQGGSGYIMTRAMARQFVAFSERWLKESVGPDDFEMSRFLSYMKKLPRDATCPFMCGHNLRELINRNIDLQKLPICPNFYESVCQQGVAKMEDLYLIHPIYSSLESGLIVWNNFQRMIHDKNHHYGWYNTFYTHVCRFD